MPKVQRVSLHQVDVDNTVTALTILGKLKSAQTILEDVVMDIEDIEDSGMESVMEKEWIEDTSEQLDALTTKIENGISGAMKVANKLNSESVENMIEENGFIIGHSVGKKSEKEMDELMEMLKKLLGVKDGEKDESKN